MAGAPVGEAVELGGGVTVSVTTMMTKRVLALSVPVAGRLRRAWSGTTWFVGGVLGADKYQRYLEHHYRNHMQPSARTLEDAACTSQPLTEREFWRQYTDRLERDPQTRCC